MEKEVSKSEYIAKQIMRRIHVHDNDSGGVVTEITGSQGSGKTSVMLSFMDYTISKYPNEKIFFSNGYFAPLQFLKIGEGKYTIMVKEGSGVTFHNRNDRLKQIKPKVVTFDTYQDCYEKAEQGKCNAVFFGNRTEWIGFIHYLRNVGEWNHIYIDEMSEIAPAFSSGNKWKSISRFAIDLKEARKCMMNVHSNSQSVADIDHRIRSKVMIKIYLPGARADNTSRISQKAIDNLMEDRINGNEAFLDYSGKFGRTVFKDIYKPTKKQWQANCVEEGFEDEG